MLIATASAALILAQADLLAGILATGVLEQRSLSELVPVIAGLGGVLALRAGLSWTQQVLAQSAAASIKASLRRRVLRRTQELGPGWLSSQHTGGIVTTLGRGLDALDPYFTGYFPQLFVAAVVPAAVLVMIATTDLASAVIVCLTLPLIPIFGILVGLQTRKATDRQWKALERLGGHFLDIVAGLPTLRAFGRAKAQAQAVRQTAEEHRAATMGTLRIAFLSALVLELVATLSVALVAVPVGLRLLNGSLDLHTALLVLLLAPEAYLPLRALGSQFHASTEGLAVAERAFAVLDEQAPGRLGWSSTADGPSAGAGHRSELTTEPRSEVAPRSRPLPAQGFGSIGPAGALVSLHDVSVRYPGRDGAALDGVSFSVAAGERVAIVGPSGAGKSTLLAVLLGLVQPTSGQVVVAGPDGSVVLDEIEIDSWRERLAWVPQRPHLFARSVAANIRLGRPSATDAQVRNAARLAHADEFIDRLPQRYETLLGERGAGVSAGQRQRIALARAFLRDAPLLLLDEPTAGLDASSEATVADATARLMRGRTVLVVAHRPAMVADADRVIRLENGTIVESSGRETMAGAR